MGDEPPCDDECGFTTINERNKLAWQIWSMLHEFERVRQIGGMGGAMSSPVPLSRMIEVNDVYGGTEADLEKIQLVERKMLPWIREQEKPKQKDGS